MGAVAPESSIRVALLLSLSGGFLDAFTYVGHGQVFANAMTGNVILFGVFSAAGEIGRAAKHIPPIFAFLAGVFMAQALRVYIARGISRRAALFSLAIEMLTLGGLAFLPRGFPDIPIVLTISFVAAFQNSSFTRVKTLSYNSVMTTGNLRRFAESLFLGILPRRDPEMLEQARIFGGICLCFLAGACIGGLTTPWVGNAALGIPAIVLGVTLLLCLRGAGAISTASG
jgi:uncharacterized membrane protein YoaK (UPF0700 family)